MWTQVGTQLRNRMVRFEGDEFQIGRIGCLTHQLEHMIDSALGSFRAARQTADAIGYAEKAQGFVAQEAVFILATDSANVGEGSAAKLHEIDLKQKS